MSNETGARRWYITAKVLVQHAVTQLAAHIRTRPSFPGTATAQQAQAMQQQKCLEQAKKVLLRNIVEAVKV